MKNEKWMSTANNNVFHSAINSKSFTHSRKSKLPSFDPLGTLHEIFDVCEKAVAQACVHIMINQINFTQMQLKQSNFFRLVSKRFSVVFNM